MKSIKKTAWLAILTLAMAFSAAAQNVTVNPGAGSYPDLTSAFNAINAGTHTGTITVDIVNSTTEPANTSAVLNSSGAGSASYTSVLVRPISDSVTITGTGGTGAACGGKGLIELNGADNVTIDGDNPNTGGINRNLTVTNTCIGTYAQVIRIALAATIVTSADNITIRNLTMNGSAPGRNMSTATSTTGTENTTYGIYASGGASIVAATTAPTTIASTATSIGAGATAANLRIENNSINSAARAVAIQGSATTVFPGLVIERNDIGNATAGAVDQVYSFGITAQGSTNAAIRVNTVYVESFLATSIRGIDTGSIGATGTGFTIERNKVNRVTNSSTGGQGAYGINLASGSSHIVRSNFVSGITNIANAAFSTTFGAFGIRVGTGTGHSILHNSVNLYGPISGTTGDLTAALCIVGTGQTTLDVRNNIFVNTQTQPAATVPGNSAYVAVYLPSGGTSSMGLTLNNNNYYIGATPAVNNGYGQAGTTPLTNFFTTFDATMTTPGTNLRSYTSTLSTSGTNDNASKNVDPQFVSAFDLHIPAMSALVNAGAAINAGRDIDNQNRVNTPDIGADETDGVAPPANDIAATAVVTPANGAILVVGGTTTPQASFTNAGLSPQFMVSVQFSISGPGGYSYTNTQIIPSIIPDQTVTVTTATVLTPDSNSSNNTQTASFSVIGPVSGTVNVGTGETYTSLTNPGGIFAAINAAGAGGNITINITSDLSGETGAVTFNELAGTFTTLIKPSGAARTISGAAPAAGGLIGFNSTDRVTLDGSLSGGTDRSLTIMLSNTANNGGGIYFGSGVNGAQNNVIKNVNVFGNGSLTGTLLGIAFGSSTFGSTGFDNDNNRIENCDVRGSFYGIAHLGASNANKDTGTVITRNVMPAVGTAGIGRVGIYVVFSDGAQITENNIASVSNPGGADTVGIAAGAQSLSNAPLASGGISNATILRNYIGVVSNNATFSAAGIVVASDVTGTNNIINNMVTGVIGNSNAGDIVTGIHINGFAGSTQNVYHNSVSMTGDRLPITANMFPSYALSIATDQPVNLRNNVLVNSQARTGSTGGGGESYAIGFDGPATNLNLLSNNNDLFVSGPLGQIGITGDLTTALQGGTAGTGTNQATLAAWQTATTEDAASITVNPLFTSATDLHIPVGSPLVNAGVDLMITTDFDGQTRDAMRDIGADEFVVVVPGTLALSSATYSVSETATTVAITVNRTGGTDGAVGATYALTNGTATGGATCGAGIDFVNTGGTVSFLNTEASKTFNVTLCPDALNKINETFNVTLSAPTGGATLGSPSTAVVTITNDDAVPSIVITDVTLAEGNAGTTSFGFTVSLSAPSGQTVTVQYATADGTATTANSDYTAISTTTLTFLPGETTKPVNVLVNGDTTNELNETFFVNLTAPTNATISDAQGQGTITNDDAQPSIAITDVTANEGNAGTTTFGFTVSLSAASGQTVTVQYATADGTATVANSDYTAITLTTLTFAPGETTKPVNVLVTGDTTVEPNENFFVNLTAPTNATILDAQGQGNITNDDSVAGGAFSVNDVRITEGNAGTVNATFTVTYTAGGAANITFATANRTATAGVDYVANTNTLTFPASGSTQTQTVSVVVNGDVVNEANETINFNLSAPTGGATVSDNQGVAVIVDEDRLYVSDFDDDAISDFSVYRPSEGRFYTRRSSNATAIVTNFGLATDRPVPGDYDKDGKNDVAVYRPSNSTFYILNSSTSTVAGFTVGVAGDKPVQGDYNGDGRTEVATFRPSNGLWSVYFIESGTSTAQLFGISTDRPVQGDYDGDAKTDLAVYRDGVWYVLLSSNASVAITNWGLSTDKPVSGDFDGDGKFDFAIYRNGQWWVINSLAGNSTVIAWGISTDIPSPADFDGDGTTDVTVFRPSSGDWYVLRSSTNTITGVNWGVSGDIPMPSATLPQ